MDDISSAVSKLLQDDKAMSYLQEIIGSSGADNDAHGHGSRMNDDSHGSDTSKDGLAGFDLGAISSITKLFSSGGNNEAERLIEALLPFLSGRRRKKASEAKKMLKIISMLPMLKASGLLDGFLGGGSD